MFKQATLNKKGKQEMCVICTNIFEQGVLTK